MARIYLASSWRNEAQPAMVKTMRDWGHVVYDFKNPDHGRGGFHWSEIDKDWMFWDAESFRYSLLNAPQAAQGYLSDYRAMEWADTFVLLLPCGRSAHLELGWACGRGKKTIIHLVKGEPELMYLMADRLTTTEDDLWSALREGD